MASYLATMADSLLDESIPEASKTVLMAMAWVSVPCRLSHGHTRGDDGGAELVALFNGFGGLHLRSWRSRSSHGLDEQTYGGDEFTRWVLLAIGASSLVGWMTLGVVHLAMYKLKGGVELFGKWFRTHMGTIMVEHREGALLLVGTVVLIVLGAADPVQSLYVWAVVATSSSSASSWCSR